MSDKLVASVESNEQRIERITKVVENYITEIAQDSPNAASFTIEVAKETLDVIDAIKSNLSRESDILAYTEPDIQPNDENYKEPEIVRYKNASDILDQSPYKQYLLQVRMKEVKE